MCFKRIEEIYILNTYIHYIINEFFSGHHDLVLSLILLFLFLSGKE